MKNYLLQSIIADDTTVIPYRKELNHLTGSVTATILLSQMLYWWKVNKRQPFYKFRVPCSHDDYNAGDSWCEELGFGEKELDNAISAICEKGRTTRKDIKNEKKQGKGYIKCWQTMDRKTYYEVNEELLEQDLKELFERLANPQNGDYETPKKGISKPPKRGLDYIDTENTAETTTEKETPTPFVQAEEINNNGAQSDKVKITPKRGGGAANFEELKEPFEAFRKYASKLGMTARGLDTEFDNFIKKFPKEAEMVIPKLLDCVKAFELEKTENGKRPIEPKYMPHVATWINQKRWESYMETEAQETDLLTKLLKMTYNEAGEYMKKMVDTKQIEREAAITIWKEYDQKRPKQFARYD